MVLIIQPLLNTAIMPPGNIPPGLYTMGCHEGAVGADSLLGGYSPCIHKSANTGLSSAWLPR